MAASAARRHCSYIDVELGGKPIRIPRLVASTALGGRCQVISRFPGGCRAIVASTAIREARVIDFGTNPSRCGLMAGFAGCCSYQVTSRLRGGDYAVMATCASRSY